MAQGRRFKKFEKRVHPYSGLDPESWKRFLVSMQTFEALVGSADLDGAADALYGSLECIRDLGLGIRHADDAQYQEELDQIAKELGYEGEFFINQNAIAKGLMFFPKYLNESLVDYPDNGRTKPIPRLRSDT